MSSTMPRSRARARLSRPRRSQPRDPNVTTISTAVSAIDCHRKIVCVNGMTPVIASNAGGMLAGFACSCAAEDDNPIAHTDPMPR